MRAVNEIKKQSIANLKGVIMKFSGSAKPPHESFFSTGLNLYFKKTFFSSVLRVIKFSVS